MVAIVLANVAFDQQKETDASSMNDAQDGLGTWSSPSTADNQVGQKKPGSYEVHVSNERIDLSDIPETATVDSITSIFNLDSNTSTAGFRFEMYEHAVNWPTQASDWPTAADLTAYFDAGERLCYFDIVTGTGLGDHSFVIDSHFAVAIQAALARGETYFEYILVSDDHRLGNDTAAVSEYITVEDSVAGQQIRTTVNYTVYDNTSDESTVLSADPPGADDSYSRYTHATYSTAAAGAGALVTAAGITMGGQSFSASNYNIYQGIERFDITGIPAGAIITDIKFEPYWQYLSSTEIFTMEVWDWNWVSFPPTAGVWQTPGELTSLYDTGKRVAWFPEADILADNTRYAMYIDGWVRRMQVAVDAAQTYFNVIVATSDNRGAVAPNTSAEYAYWEDGDGGVNAANLTVYYTLPGGGINAGMMGAIA